MQVVYQDKTLVCRHCGQEFIWTSGEQTFYAAKGLDNQPVRCPSCRIAARHARNGTSVASTARPREFFAAVCDRCGVQAQVPFLPRHDKPVYCSTCYDEVRADRVAYGAR